MKCWRSEDEGGVIENLLPEVWETFGEGEVVDMGGFKRPDGSGAWGEKKRHSTGWVGHFFLVASGSTVLISTSEQIFFDLLHPTSYRLHLQLYLRLSSSGSAIAQLGLFDLDSSLSNPCPIPVGRVEIVRSSHSSSPLPTHSSSSISPQLLHSNFKDHFPGSISEVRYFLTPEVSLLKNEVDDSTRLGLFKFAQMPAFKKRMVVSTWVGGDEGRRRRGGRVCLLIQLS